MGSEKRRDFSLNSRPEMAFPGEDKTRLRQENCSRRATQVTEGKKPTGLLPPARPWMWLGGFSFVGSKAIFGTSAALVRNYY